MVYYGRVSGVYSSWKEVGPLVTGYENNLHKGYKTSEEMEGAYSQFLSQ
jgi:viroplasmin and RNaseH domain-containing protein